MNIESIETGELGPVLSNSEVLCYPVALQLLERRQEDSLHRPRHTASTEKHEELLAKTRSYLEQVSEGVASVLEHEMLLRRRIRRRQQPPNVMDHLEEEPNIIHNRDAGSELRPFEATMIATLIPLTVAEAVYYIPTLDGYDPLEIQAILNELRGII